MLAHRQIAFPRPAFFSNWHCVGYSAVLVFLLSLPMVLDRMESAKHVPRFAGMEEAASIGRFLYDQSEDVDILFLGNSRMLTDIDALGLQTRLAQHLGRQARVQILGINFPGRDVAYALLDDALKHHRVKMTVLSMNETPSAEDWPHKLAAKWMRPGDFPEILSTLPMKYRARIYALRVIGGLRLMLYSFFPPQTLYPEAPSLGARITEEGYRGELYRKQPPKPLDLSLDETLPFLGGKENRQSFQIVTGSRSVYQDRFLDRIFERLREARSGVAFLNVPSYPERNHTTMTESSYWPDVFGKRITMIGAAPARLFAGLSEEEVRALFHDGAHLNANGQKYFTHAVAPAIVEAYDEIIGNP